MSAFLGEEELLRRDTMNHTKQQTRENNWKHALRKRRIAREVLKWDYYNNLHQYSKNKIHCSCPLCSAKTNNKGKARLRSGNYDPSKNWKHSELQKIQSMNEQIEEISASGE